MKLVTRARAFVVTQKDKAAVATLIFIASVNANAAIDASVSAALTAVETDAKALSAIVVPIVVSVLGLSLVIKLIKRFGNKI